MKENAEYIERLERFKSTFTLALNVYQRYSMNSNLSVNPL
jgi:hypothetical protein